MGKPTTRTTGIIFSLTLLRRKRMNSIQIDLINLSRVKFMEDIAVWVPRINRGRNIT